MLNLNVTDFRSAPLFPIAHTAEVHSIHPARKGLYVLARGRSFRPARSKQKSVSSRWWPPGRIAARDLIAVMGAIVAAILAAIAGPIASSYLSPTPANPIIGAPANPTTSAPQEGGPGNATTKPPPDSPGNTPPDSPGNTPTPNPESNVPIVPGPNQIDHGLQHTPTLDPSVQNDPSIRHPARTLWPIKINPISYPVPRCTNFEGTGDVPKGQILWLMVYTPGAQRYHPKPVTIIESEHKWIAQNVNIGAKDDPAGTIYVIYATLVDNATNSTLQQSDSTGLEDLPGTKVADLRISRNNNTAACKQG